GRPLPRLALISIIAGAVVLAALAIFFFARDKAQAPAALSGMRAAYVEFGATADTLWLARPQDPGVRQRVLSVPHALGFGIAPSLSPRGDAVAYSLLPPETASPARDSPADLYVAPFGGGEPKLLVHVIDPLVRPLSASDG